MKTVAIIPARGGSKRFPRKNIYPIWGKPMIAWAITAARAAQEVSEVYVSTEDVEIAQVAAHWGAKVIPRPEELAGDKVWTQDVLQHAVSYLQDQGEKYEIIVRLQANSPQVEAAKIDEAIRMLKEKDLWEVFSVDEQGLEDAAIHVLKNEVVWQKALSVYKGVVRTDYRDVHKLKDIHDIEIQEINKLETKTFSFLDKKEKRSLRRDWHQWLPTRWRPRRRRLWVWQTTIPLVRRWQAIVENSPDLQRLINAKDGAERASKMAVLDLGCGFGMYWPILRKYGFRTFTGIDLYDLRFRDDYYLTAKEYIREFCGNCETQIIMDDARNLDKHRLQTEKYDLILNVANMSKKLNSTGIPQDLVDKIAAKYGSTDAIVIHLAGVP